MQVRLGGDEVETLGRRSSLIGLNLTTTATIQVVRASPSCISGQCPCIFLFFWVFFVFVIFRRFFGVFHTYNCFHFLVLCSNHSPCHCQLYSVCP